MSKNVIEKSEDMLGKIDIRYDMKIPEIQEIMDYHTDAAAAICCAFRYGYLQGEKAAKKPWYIERIVNLLKKMESSEVKDLYYLVQGLAGEAV